MGEKLREIPKLDRLGQNGKSFMADALEANLSPEEMSKVPEILARRVEKHGDDHAKKNPLETAINNMAHSLAMQGDTAIYKWLDAMRGTRHFEAISIAVKEFTHLRPR